MRLEEQDSRLLCKNGHSYDRAKSGYVNLLMSQQPKEKRHGDDKRMVRARRSFLEGGFYTPLLEKMLELIEKYTKNHDVILDAGCGECWYTHRVYRHLTGRSLQITALGIDISKTAIDFAAKRSSEIGLAVASVYEMPVADHSCNMVLSVFAPCGVSECTRVLKESGFLIRVIPLERHLWSLKEKIYEKPYENVVEGCELGGFRLLERQELRGVLELARNEDIQNLFLMTPYYYKTSREDQNKVEGLARLETEIEFAILVYQKEKHSPAL